MARATAFGTSLGVHAAVLAAVVLVAVKGLIDVPELNHLWRTSRLDFAAAGVAFSGVLLMGVLDGVLLAVLASILMLLARVSRPYVAFLGRIPGTNRFFSVVQAVRPATVFLTMGPSPSRTSGTFNPSGSSGVPVTALSVVLRSRGLICFLA